MDWIYLSPHLDDVALSCGGLVWEQNQTSEMARIWTICAGDPPAGPLSSFAESLHQRWQTGREATQQRRQEDIRSCQRLGATWLHFCLPDCIYRKANPDGKHLYTSEEGIFGELHPSEQILVDQLSHDILDLLPAKAELVAPLALGGHVDHRLVRIAAEKTERPIWYYPDYPYVLKAEKELNQLRQAGWQTSQFKITPAGLLAWQEAIEEHSSQISTFWPDLTNMRLAIQSFYAADAGGTLWHPPKTT